MREPTIEFVEPRERIEKEILDAFANDYEPHPREIAEVLVDGDVAAGLYEGCSSELEACFVEYARLAAAVLGVDPEGAI